MSANSETEKYRHLTSRLCQGCGVDVGSQGATVVPWAVSFDLPKEEFDHYCSNEPAKGPVHLRGDCRKLPFETDSLDFLYSSHLIEDFPFDEWPAIFTEWKRVLRPGGNMIVLAPERGLWHAYLQGGGLPNCSHRHEPELGDFRKVGDQVGLLLVQEFLTNVYPGDYTIMAVFTKWAPFQLNEG